MPLTFLRSFLLGFGILAALTATVLDAITLRYVLQPMVGLAMRGADPNEVRLPMPFEFMLTHAWARRVYNLLFAALALSAWWYLGTPAGQSAFARLH